MFHCTFTVVDESTVSGVPTMSVKDGMNLEFNLN